jgi:hypothetical protein
MIAYAKHCYACCLANMAYVRRKAFEKTTLVAFFGGAPLMYAAPTRFWQAFVALGILIGLIMPDPPKGGCDEH